VTDPPALVRRDLPLPEDPPPLDPRPPLDDPLRYGETGLKYEEYEEYDRDRPPPRGAIRSSGR
jgi:hypothetical protein